MKTVVKHNIDIQIITANGCTFAFGAILH